MLRNIKISQLEESPWQGRMVLFSNEKDEYTQRHIESLAADIRENGLLNPVIVRPKGKKYELIDGHRRVIASKLLGLKTIDAIVHDYDDRHAQVSSITANLQRKDLSAIELAVAYQKILDSGIFKDKKELSRAIGKDETYIGDLINTLNMDERIVADLKKNKTINDVRMLRAIRRYGKGDIPGHSEAQWKLYQRILSEKLSRQEVLGLSRQNTLSANPADYNYDITVSGSKAHIQLPVKLSKDQKKVFVNLLKKELPDILKTIIG